MAEYRWNQSELAAAYDESAQHVHPYYRELQEVVVERLGFLAGRPALVLDAGGGSGRLVERILERFPQVTAVVLDQSDSFLALAQKRLKRFGPRAHTLLARLQEDIADRVPGPLDAIVSMSAIHHLEPAEKRACYARCYRMLAPGGALINADEVRPEDDATYLEYCRTWASHMRDVVAQGLVSPAMADALRKWEARNVDRFAEPRHSGDDCHETIDTQRHYLLDCGFDHVDVPWQKQLWAVFDARKTSTESHHSRAV